MSERPQITPNQNIALMGEVGGLCPLCGQPLMYKKKGANYKGYEIAHIYPLKPLPGEAALLEGEERLSPDVNDEKNLIPLCNNCHNRFDKPRTVSEYRDLVAMKKAIIGQIAERLVWNDYSLKDAIKTVVFALSRIDDSEIEGSLLLEPLTVDGKTQNKLPHVIRIKIKANVRNYFTLIRAEFTEIERQSPGLSTHIAQQIKLYHDDQKLRDLSQAEIYRNIVDWINIRTANQSLEACDVIASFFVQNCEVFP